MRKLFTILVALLLITAVYAQTPDKISYQAVIRNSSNILVTSSPVGMRVSILSGSETGTEVYKEIYNPNPQTNSNGLVTIEIGGGIPLTGIFASINWSAGTYFIKTEIDPGGGTNYTIIGTSKLLSVPYALYAKTAGNVVESDPIFIQSVASGIKSTDITNWNNKLNNYSESQNLADVIKKNNSANSQIKNLIDPTDAQDAATKAYVDELKTQITELQLLAGIRIKDIDGNIYKIVTIGTQIWMAENLKTTHYNDGTAIPKVSDESTWFGLSTPAYCLYNFDSARYKASYGALYNWYTVNTSKLCPTGWHVPTDAEWTTLITQLGGETLAGGKLKEIGTTNWDSPNIGATNESGFTALPGGYLTMGLGIFDGIGKWGAWWTSLESSSSYAWFRGLGSDRNSVDKNTNPKNDGYSVRCIKD